MPREAIGTGLAKKNTFPAVLLFVFFCFFSHENKNISNRIFFLFFLFFLSNFFSRKSACGQIALVFFDHTPRVLRARELLFLQPLHQGASSFQTGLTANSGCRIVAGGDVLPDPTFAAEVVEVEAGPPLIEEEASGAENPLVVGGGGGDGEVHLHGVEETAIIAVRGPPLQRVDRGVFLIKYGTSFGQSRRSEGSPAQLLLLRGVGRHQSDHVVENAIDHRLLQAAFEREVGELQGVGAR
jgi:hypothetical protein